MLTRMYKTGMIICGSFFAMQNVYAGFATYTDNWPDGADVVDERIIPKTPPAPASIPNNPGECPSVITFDGVKPICEDKRLYIKFGGNYLTSKVSDVENNSSGVFGGLTLWSQSASESYYSWEVGLGTRIDCFRFELEYVYTKTLQYNATPAFESRSEGILSTVRNDSVLLNAFWDFDAFAYFKPYVGVLGGIAYNRTSAALVGGTLGDNVNYETRYLSVLVWGFTAGGRIPFWQRWRGYVQYRYTNQGKVQWRTSSDVALQGYYVLNGLSMGVAYIF